MLTGASEADAAVLLASTKEGIQDQTKEHLFLITILGIKQVVIAASKMDLIGYDEEKFNQFSTELKKMLSSLGYHDVPIIPLSAYEGENVTKKSKKMKWYKGKPLIEVLDKIINPPKPSSHKPLRCVVQDLYPTDKEDMAVCKVETGTLKAGESVVVMPVAQETVVTGIDSFGEPVEKAFPGDSVGVILKSTENLQRGYVLAEAGEQLVQTKAFVAELIIFADLTLKAGDRVPIRLGTAEVECEIQHVLERIDAVNLTVVEEKPKSLENGEVGKILFKPLQPLYVETYSDFPELGRFVIIGKKGAVAAGIILEKS
jgi:elongation factor 1-alpha